MSVTSLSASVIGIDSKDDRGRSVVGTRLVKMTKIVSQALEVLKGLSDRVEEVKVHWHFFPEQVGQPACVNAELKIKLNTGLEVIEVPVILEQRFLTGTRISANEVISDREMELLEQAAALRVAKAVRKYACESWGKAMEEAAALDLEPSDPHRV